MPLDQHGDIYIDAADSTGVSLNPVKAHQWVLAQLKEQGIVLRPLSCQRCLTGRRDTMSLRQDLTRVYAVMVAVLLAVAAMIWLLMLPLFSS